MEAEQGSGVLTFEALSLITPGLNLTLRLRRCGLELRFVLERGLKLEHISLSHNRQTQQ
jgi:hypothetical protein